MCSFPREWEPDSAPTTPVWADSKLLLSPRVRVHAMGAQSVLFCERTQRLFDLNSTATFIWRALELGATCRDISRAIEEQGVAPISATAFASSQIEAWIRAGYLLPAEANALCSEPPTASRTVSLGTLAVNLVFRGEACADEYDQVFERLYISDRAALKTIDVLGWGGHEFLLADDVPFAMSARGGAAALIKGALSDAVCESVGDGFITHGALVSLNGKRALLCGASGEGKTTLTLALTASGFAYETDDIVCIDRAGNVSGIPFPAAAKAEGWSLVEGFVPGLYFLPVFCRADGQRVRYIVPDASEAGGDQQLGAVILLDRDGRGNAELTSIPPLDALREIIASGYSPNARLKPAALAGLTAQLSLTPCFRLSYGDLASAVSTIAGAL